MKLKTSILFFVALFVAQFASAQQWQFVGPRAMGMGGAGVATAYGPDAQYWNPAGLVQEEDKNETGLLINAGVTLETTGKVLGSVDKLADMADRYKNLSNNISGNSAATAENISTIFEGLNEISKLLGDNMGVLVNADAGLGFKFKNFAISSRAIGTGAVRPVLDTQNIKFNTAGSGLNIGTNVTDPSVGDPSLTAAVSSLTQVITDYNLLSVIQNFLGNTTAANAGELASQLINVAIAQGASVAQINEMVGVVVENAGGAAEMLHQYTASTGTYDQNETLAMGDVAAFGEVALGYGTQVIKGLKVGGNVKVISGYTAETGVMLLSDNDDFKDILDKAFDNKKNTNTWAVDLGALVNFSEMLGKDIWWNPQVGVTARNINGPKFDRPDMPASFIGTPIANPGNWKTDKYQLKPQIRAGVSVNPKNWMTLAVDIDVTENDTLLDGIKSRQLAVGMEINLVNGRKFNMPLRLGYNKNLAETSLCPFYTAGIGFNMLHFFVELAGAVSTKTSKVDGNTIPNSAAASLTLGFLF